MPQDDLLAELEELEQEALDEQLLETGPAVSDKLPEVPTAVPAQAARKKKEEDDADMAELAAWASQAIVLSTCVRLNGK